MKVRTGFVSNSSSSSFILAFQNAINSIEDVIKIFGDKLNESYSSIDYNGYTATFNKKDIIQSIYEQIKENGITTKDDFINEIKSGNTEFYYSDYENPDIDPDGFEGSGYLSFITEEESILIFGKDGTKFFEDEQKRLLPILTERARKFFIDNKDLISPNLSNYRDKVSGEYDEISYYRDTDIWAERVYNKFIKENADKVCYIVEYSDNGDLFGSFMEHELNWDYFVKNIRISKH